ncbi:MAG: GNAT family N-acetyltransferase [Thermoplasmata archaeon]
MTHRKASRATLRRFRIEDASDICGIYAMFFVDNAVHFGAGRITVAEVEHRVVGFVMWSPAFEPAWFDPGVERWAELVELHVHGEFHNQGIGTRLVRAAIRQALAAGYAAMYLETEASNGPARRVYEKGGFREHNRLVRYKIDLGTSALGSVIRPRVSPCRSGPSGDALNNPRRSSSTP